MGKDCSINFCTGSMCVPDTGIAITKCGEVWNCDVDIVGETKYLYGNSGKNVTVWAVARSDTHKVRKCLNDQGLEFTGGDTCVTGPCSDGKSGMAHKDGPKPVSYTHLTLPTNREV